MRLRDLLNKWKIPILMIGIILILTTFLSYFIGFQLALEKSNSTTHLVFYNVITQLDLTGAANFATWFKTILLFLIGLSLAVLGSAEKENFPLNAGQKLIFKFISFGFICFSVLEIIGMYGKIIRKINLTREIVNMQLTRSLHLSFNIYILIFIVLLILSLIMHKLIKNIKNKQKKATSYRYLFIIIVTFFLLMLLEFLFGRSQILPARISFADNLLEFFEIVILVNLYFLLTDLNINYKL